LPPAAAGVSSRHEKPAPTCAPLQADHLRPLTGPDLMGTKTQGRTALSPRLLIRPPWPGAATRDENRWAELGFPWCNRAR
jgi:hypothetical protein